MLVRELLISWTVLCLALTSNGQIDGSGSMTGFVTIRPTLPSQATTGAETAGAETTGAETTVAETTGAETTTVVLVEETPTSLGITTSDTPEAGIAGGANATAVPTVVSTTATDAPVPPPSATTGAPPAATPPQPSATTALPPAPGSTFLPPTGTEFPFSTEPPTSLPPQCTCEFECSNPRVACVDCPELSFADTRNRESCNSCLRRCYSEEQFSQCKNRCSSQRNCPTNVQVMRKIQRSPPRCRNCVLSNCARSSRGRGRRVSIERSECLYLARKECKSCAFNRIEIQTRLNCGSCLNTCIEELNAPAPNTMGPGSPPSPGPTPTLGPGGPTDTIGSGPGPTPPLGPGPTPPLGPGPTPPLGPGQRPPLGPGQRPPLGPGQRPPFGPGKRPPLGPGLPFRPGRQGPLRPGPKTLPGPNLRPGFRPKPKPRILRPKFAQQPIFKNRKPASRSRYYPQHRPTYYKRPYYPTQRPYQPRYYKKHYNRYRSPSHYYYG